MKQSEFESQLVEMFEDNFRFLCEEAGHSINEYLKNWRLTKSFIIIARIRKLLSR